MVKRTPRERHWILLRILASRRYGVTVEEMARESGVSTKTIRRDLEHFQQLALAMEEKTEEHGRKRWKLSQQCLAAPLTFTFEEALALYLSRDLLDPLTGTVQGEACQSAFSKVRSALNDHAIDYLERLADRVCSRTVGSDYTEKREILDNLLEAVVHSLQTVMTYRSASSTEPYEIAIDPYGLVYHRGSFYLIAFSHEHKEIRHFKVDRIHDLEISQLPFQRPADFEVRTHLKDSFGIFHGQRTTQVRIRFRREVAAYVHEVKRHHSQRLIDQKDGSVIAEFTLNAIEEIRSWILSFGSKAEVLAPESLRDDLRREFATLGELYDQPATRRTQAFQQQQ